MRRFLALCAVLLAVAMVLPVKARAADTQVFYPTAVERSEDGTEIRKMYDLGPEDDPGGIPRSDFEQGGFHYTLIDLPRQEAPEYQERAHTETYTVESPSKDMETVLDLLPQEREYMSEDGFYGTLTLRLETVQVEVAGYGSSSKTVTATRSYPNLAGQDTSYIPKTIQESGRTMTLQDIQWETDNTASVDGYAMGDRYTAVATYSGTATSSYVTGYNVSAEYAGTISRIALDRVRYVAIFEGTPLVPIEPEEPVIIPMEDPPVPDEPSVPDDITPPDGAEQPDEPAVEPFGFKWTYILAPLAVVAVAGGGIGLALLIKRKQEHDEGGDSE